MLTAPRITTCHGGLAGDLAGLHAAHPVRHAQQRRLAGAVRASPRPDGVAAGVLVDQARRVQADGRRAGDFEAQRHVGVAALEREQPPIERFEVQPLVGRSQDVREKLRPARQPDRSGEIGASARLRRRLAGQGAYRSAPSV